MTQRSIAFDTLANGTVATSGNTGIDNLNKGTGTTATITTATTGNGLAALELVPVSGQVIQAIMNFTANASVACSFKFRMPSLPTATSQVFMVAPSGTPMGQILLSAAGKLQAFDAASASMGAASSAFFTANTWYRFDITATVGTSSTTGTFKVKVFAGDDNTTPLWTQESTACNMGTTNFANVRLGRPSGSTDVTHILIDSIEVNDGATSYIGPWVDTVNAGSDQTGVAAAATVTVTASGVKNGLVSWSQVSGTTVTLSGTGLSRTFTAPLDGPASIVLRATSGSVTDDVSISYLSNTVDGVTAGSDQTGISAGDTATLTATSTSGSATWSQISGTTVSILGSGALSRTFTAPWDGPGTLVFRATNGTATDDVSISYVGRVAPDLSIDFDELVNGTAINTANSGMTQINLGTGSTAFERTATPGDGAGSLELTAASGQVAQAIEVFDATPSVSLSVKCRIPANLSATSNTIQIFANSTVVATLQISATGAIAVVNAASSVQGSNSSAGLMAANTWMRIEVVLTVGTTTSNGVLKVKVFSGNSITPSYVNESIVANVGTVNVTKVSFGRPTGSTDTTAMLWDSFQLNPGDAHFIGPWTQSIPIANAGPDQTVSALDTVTLAGSGTNTPTSYAWSQTSGTSVTLSSTTAASPTFTAPPLSGGDNLVFSFTATNGSGTSVADTVTIAVAAQIEWVAGTDNTWHAEQVTLL